MDVEGFGIAAIRLDREDQRDAEVEAGTRRQARVGDEDELDRLVPGEAHGVATKALVVVTWAAMFERGRTPLIQDAMAPIACGWSSGR